MSDPVIQIHPINNGLTHSAYRRRTGRIKFIDIVPPIEQEIVDEKCVQSTFERFPLIPYSGTSKVTSHRMVSLLYNLRNMSPTFGGIVEGKKNYALRGKINVVKQRDLIFNIGNEKNELPVGEQIKFVEELHKSFIFKPGSLKKISEAASDSYDSTGMIAIYVKITPYLGVTKVCVKYEHPTDYVFYKNAEWGTEMALSKCWDDIYLDKFPPNIVPVYPLERVDRDGTIHTIFYVKNGGYIYGRPGDMGALHDKYNEYKLKQLISKKCKKSFTPDAMIEFEDGQMAGSLLDNDKAIALGYQDAGDRIDDRLSNEGDDPRSLYVTTRPKDAKPAFVHEFSTLKNAKDVNLYLEEAEQTILQANNYPEMLYKLSGATGFSNDVFMDVFNIYNVTFNDERQTLLESLFNEIFNYGFSKLGIDNTTGIQYTSPIQTMLDEYNQRKRGPEIIPGGKEFGVENKTDL